MAVKLACQSISRSVIREAHRWGRMKQTGVTLKYMMQFGSKPTNRNLLLSAHFLHKELPIRIARRAIELETLPYGLSHKPTVSKIRNSSDEREFTKMLQAIKVRHNDVVPMIALGVRQLHKERGAKLAKAHLDAIQQCLDRFLLTRIGLRMLIDTRMSPVVVARNASEDARAMCMREYASAPDVQIYGDPGFTFPYVPAHLHHMVFELVKNSLRAVQEIFLNSDNVPPPIRIIVAEGLEDVTIKVSDEGGGIPRSGLSKNFNYLHTSGRNPLHESIDLGVANTAVTMSGYGCGIPISRSYARYFGGDLQIISMEGYGTEAYLHLLRLGDSQEPLP